MKSVKNQNEQMPQAVDLLRNLFQENKEKRICVVGSSCSGKSTLRGYFSEAVDMDELLFGSKEKGIKPLLTQQEREYVCGPWTEKVGKFMVQKAKELIIVESGHPVFGTVIFPSDLVIEITVPENLLRERIKNRNAQETDVLNMKKQIEEEIEKSGIKKVTVENI